MQIVKIADYFVGREKEINEFKTWLENADHAAPWIFYVHDALEEKEKKGGVGKTWLLRKCAKIAREMYADMVVVQVDFFNVADREGVVIADRVVDALKAAYPRWTSRTFGQILQEYRAALQQGKEEDAVVVRDRLADALAADLRLLEAQLEDERRYLLVFLDTFEVIEQNPMTTVLRLAEAFPDNYQFRRLGVVMAGRNAIDWSQVNWRGRHHEVKIVPIAPFTPEEMQQYLNTMLRVNLSIEPEQAAALYERTEGRPILVGLATDVLNHSILTLKELLAIPGERFEQSLVAQINRLERPIDQVVMLMAHAYHRFNLAMLDWLLQEAPYTDLRQDVDFEALPEQLLSLSFIRHPSTGERTTFVLHDEMYPLVIKHCWDVQDPDLRIRKAISSSLIRYYEHELANVKLEQLRHAYTVEMLYHKLYVDLDDGYQYFDRHFLRAASLRMNAFARSLLKEAQKFANRMSLAQQLNLKFAEALLLRKEENVSMALALLEELEAADPDWVSKKRTDLLFEKGVCQQQLSRFDEAIASFTVLMDLYKQQGQTKNQGNLLTWLGYIQRRQGQLDAALRYYEECLALSQGPENESVYASALVNISNVYRLQGRMEEALRKCKLGWRIRAERFKKGRLSEVYVGWSLSTMGAIYLHMDDLVNAEHFFREAYDIFVRIGHKKGMATMQNRFGQIALAKGNLQEAIQWFEKAYYMSLGVDTEAQVNSLNKQGWVLALQHRLEEGATTLKQAVELAREAHDGYQQAESLIDLAEVLERLGQHKPSQQALQEAETISRKYNYNYLLGLARESQGDIHYQRGNLQEAFRRYAEACSCMARYNAIKFTKTLRKVVNALAEIPYEQVGPIVDELVAYWISQELADDYPDFIESCEGVRQDVDRLVSPETGSNHATVWNKKPSTQD